MRWGDARALDIHFVRCIKIIELNIVWYFKVERNRLNFGSVAFYGCREVRRGSVRPRCNLSEANVVEPEGGRTWTS